MLKLLPSSLARSGRIISLVKQAAVLEFTTVRGISWSILALLRKQCVPENQVRSTWREGG
jgi:hypothetical protein